MNNLKRLFENDFKKVKKYFIDDMSRQAQIYYLFRLDSRIEDTLYVTKLYDYDIQFQKIEKNEDNERFEIVISEFEIIFESDNLKDVKDYLEMLCNTNKYNL